MANKQLTAKVKLNTKQAEQAIERLTKKLNKLTQGLNKVSGGGSAEATARKITQQTAKQNNKLNEQIDKHKKLNALNKSKLDMMKRQNRSMDTMLSKLKAIGAAYLGVMGFKAAIGVSDSFTSAENKLNYVNSTTNGGYNAGTFRATQDAMDKMYTSSQKVRMDYTDMMANVSKSMVLAGRAFGDNIDNAIRFQEIMAEAYAVGGASPAEMSSSMYQLIQALGSGQLAGDELRSVREGAPLAFQKIEQFAQGVYDTTESLKDMASQGKITSDMVVKAILTAGNELDTAFAQTQETFGQLGTQAKNIIKRAFLPVAKKLTKMINQAIQNGLIAKLEYAFGKISIFLQNVLDKVTEVVSWASEHWDLLKQALLVGLELVIAKTVAFGIVSIATAVEAAKKWWKLNGAIMAVAGGLSIISTGFVAWKMQAMDTVNAISTGVIGIGLVLTKVFGAIAGVIGAAAAMIIGAMDLVLGIVYSVGAWIYNTVFGLINGIMEIVWSLINAIAQVWDLIYNVLVGGFDNLIGVVKNVCGKILGFFVGLWKGVTRIIDAIFDTNYTASVTIAQDNFNNWGKNESGRKTTSAMSGLNELLGLPNSIDPNKAFDKGFNTGRGWLDSINKWGSKFQGFNLLGENPFGDSDPLKTTDIQNMVGNIDTNTGKIADSTQMTADDLKYLRDLAEVEWKKEYTTASIVVEMNNDNTINGDGDLDGIVTKLSDKLYEEMSVLANGSYAYTGV